MNAKLMCELLLTPPTFNLAFLTLTYIILWFSPKMGRRFVLYNIIFLYILATPIFFFNTIGKIEYTKPLRSFDHKADAIVVLGGGSFQAPEYGEGAVQPPPFALERVRYAAYLHKKTQLPIITSGGAAKKAKNLESHIFATILKDDYGITDVIEENKSRNTNENGVYTKKIAEARNFKTIYLVTNSFHMNRSKYIFEYYGFKVIPAPTVIYSIQRPKYFFQYFIPSSHVLRQSQILILEFIGKLAYTITGRPF